MRLLGNHEIGDKVNILVRTSIDSKCEKCGGPRSVYGYKIYSGGESRTITGILNEKDGKIFYSFKEYEWSEFSSGIFVIPANDVLTLEEDAEAIVNYRNEEILNKEVK